MFDLGVSRTDVIYCKNEVFLNRTRQTANLDQWVGASVMLPFAKLAKNIAKVAE